MTDIKPDPRRLVSQTLFACPHCQNDFLVNEAGDGSISIERVDIPPRSIPPPPQTKGRTDDESVRPKDESEDDDRRVRTPRQPTQAGAHQHERNPNRR